MERTLRQMHNVLKQHDDDLLTKFCEYLSLPDDVQQELKENILMDSEGSKKSKKLNPKERCNALLSDGTQCTRRHLKAQNKEPDMNDELRKYCLIHSSKRIGEISSRDCENHDDLTSKKHKGSSSKGVKKMLKSVLKEKTDHQVPVIDIKELHVKKVIYNGESYLVDESRNIVLKDDIENPTVIGHYINGAIQLLR